MSSVIPQIVTLKLRAASLHMLQNQLVGIVVPSSLVQLQTASHQTVDRSKHFITSQILYNGSYLLVSRHGLVLSLSLNQMVFPDTCATTCHQNVGDIQYDEAKRKRQTVDPLCLTALFSSCVWIQSYSPLTQRNVSYTPFHVLQPQ